MLPLVCATLRGAFVSWSTSLPTRRFGQIRQRSSGSSDGPTLTGRRARVVALIRLLAAVVGLMFGAYVYGAGYGAWPSLASGVGAYACAHWILSLGLRQMPTPDPVAQVELDRELPMRREVSARKSKRNRRRLLREDP